MFDTIPNMRSAALVRASELGFIPELTTWGDLYRRIVDVDLAEAAWAGGPLPAPRPAQLALLDERLSGIRLPASGRVVALDIEAVSIAPGHLAAFLVGAASWEGRRIRLQQWLLADLSGEAVLLDAVSAALRGALLVTYNGRAFDTRVLASRCVANGMHPSSVEPRAHLDLLAPVRRRLRGSGHGCTLRQVEWALLGVDRGEDVPGAEGPARYRAWLRGAPASVMEGVVRHNELDVISTIGVAARLAADWTALTPMEVARRYNVSR